MRNMIAGVWHLRMRIKQALRKLRFLTHVNEIWILARSRRPRPFETEAPSVRIKLEGFRPGTYVRVVLEQVPCEFIQHFDAAISGTPWRTSSERRELWVSADPNQETSLVQAYAQEQRSACFLRGMASIPVYPAVLTQRQHSPIECSNTRPSTCTAWLLLLSTGHLPHPVLGFCAFQSLDGQMKQFRIAATGVLLELDKSFQIRQEAEITNRTAEPCVPKHSIHTRDVHD